MKTKSIFATLAAFAMILGFGMPANAADQPTPSEPGWQHILFIESGTKWEMKVKSNVFTDESAFTATQWIDKYDEIDGRAYMELWSQTENDTPQLISYLRIEGGRIFAISANDMQRGECLVYDFCRTDVTRDLLVPMNWDGTLSDKAYLYTSKSNGELDFSQLAGFKYQILSVSLFEEDDTDATDCVGTIDWYHGIGSPAGLTNQCYCLDSEYTSKLIKVYHNGSELVYDKSDEYDTPQAAVEGIVDASCNDGVRYRPDGTRFNDGDKGIYIMNGKKYVAR